MELQVALVSPVDPGTIMALLDLQRDIVRFEEQQDAFRHTQEVMTRVIQFSQTIRNVQMVCKHPQLIINLQRQITDLHTT